MYETESGLIPCDIDAERRAVGSGLLSLEALDLAMNQLTKSDFWYNPHQWIFDAAGWLRVADKPVNAASVITRLSEMRPSKDAKKSCLDEIGREGVLKTIEGVLPEDVDFWCKRLIKVRKERELLFFAEDAKRVALSGGDDIHGNLAKLEESLSRVSGTDAERTVFTVAETTEELSHRFQRYLDDPEAISGMSTGWTRFDRTLDGLEGGSVIICYAPTSRFKSMFTLNIGWRLARQGIPGFWFTTEMPRRSVTERLVQVEGAMNLLQMRHDGTYAKRYDEVKSALAQVKNYPIYMTDRMPLDIAMVKAEVARQKRWHDIKYVIVDLLDHVSSQRYNDNEIGNQSRVMQEMKGIAKQFDVCVILTTHVSKGERSIRNSQPDLEVDDMKGSSSKGQDADVAISLACVGKNEETGGWYPLSREQIESRNRNGGNHTILVSITKNRNGPIARMPFRLSLSRGGRMSEMEEAQPRQIEMKDDEAE